jgi:hypothetical protein
MDVRQVLTSQYQAALTILEDCIRACPPDLWIDPQARSQFWQIAYHALFYTHLYLQKSEATFKPWGRHRTDYQYLGPIEWDDNRVPQIGAPFSPNEVLEYLDFCRAEVESRLRSTDFAAPSGFDWLPFNKLELQIYTIRHLQHHNGELSARLSERGIKTHWIVQGDG